MNPSPKECLWCILIWFCWMMLSIFLFWTCFFDKVNSWGYIHKLLESKGEGGVVTQMSTIIRTEPRLKNTALFKDLLEQEDRTYVVNLPTWFMESPLGLWALLSRQLRIRASQIRNQQAARFWNLTLFAQRGLKYMNLILQIHRSNKDIILTQFDLMYM